MGHGKSRGDLGSVNVYGDACTITVGGMVPGNSGCNVRMFGHGLVD